MGHWGFFSDRENSIIINIGKATRTIREIADVVLPNDMDGDIKVSSSIRRIIKKCDHYGLKWTLKKMRTNGRLLITKEKR